MEAIKWFALIAMTIDHASRFFLSIPQYQAYSVGRLALPLFAFILSYNFAKPDALARGLYRRVFIRLIIFGILATPGYIAMRHLSGVLPLNIMFTLAVAVAILYLHETGSLVNRLLAFFLFLIGSIFVEYDWVGVFLCLSSWFYCRKPSLLSLFTLIFAFLLLNAQNENHWAALSLVIIYLGTKIDLKVPRIRYLFYIYYPLHLSILYLLTKLL